MTAKGKRATTTYQDSGEPSLELKGLKTGPEEDLKAAEGSGGIGISTGRSPTDVFLGKSFHVPKPSPGMLTRFGKGNSGGRGKRPKLATLGIDTKYLDIKDPRYGSCMRRAEFYVRRRRSEYMSRFGSVSVGVNAMLAQAALFLAASKYMVQIASECAGVQHKLFFAYMDLANKMSKEARACEISAWDLCQKENKASDDQNPETPWLTTSADTEDVAGD